MLHLFIPKPPRWGLRGDPYLWADFETHFNTTHYTNLHEYSSADFKELLLQIFHTLTGQVLDYLEGNEVIFIEAYDKGGMSSGCVSGKFWLETGIPLLLERFEYWKNNHILNKE